MANKLTQEEEDSFYSFDAIFRLLNKKLKSFEDEFHKSRSQSIEMMKIYHHFRKAGKYVEKFKIKFCPKLLKLSDLPQPSTSSSGNAKNDRPPSPSSSEDDLEPKPYKIPKIKKEPEDVKPTIKFNLNPIATEPLKFVLKKENEPAPDSEPHPKSVDAKEIPKSPQEENKPQVTFYANNFKTRQHTGLDEDTKLTFFGDFPVFSFVAPVKGRSKQLHNLVRKKLNLPEFARLNLYMVQYIKIDDNDKDIWSYGIRRFPTAICALPDDLAEGQTFKFSYHGLGPNNNGNRMFFEERQARRP